MLQKSKIILGSQEWGLNKRYKVNAVVLKNGITYQNSKGINTDPEIDNGNWINLSSDLKVSKIQFTSNGVDATYNILNTAKVKAVFWNGALLDDSNWTQTANILTLTFIPSLNDIIKPI